MKTILLFTLVVLSCQNVKAQLSEPFYNESEVLKSISSQNFFQKSEKLISGIKSNDPENYKILVSLGFGYGFNNYNNDNIMFSIDVIPKLSKKFYLDFKLDGIKQSESILTLVSIIPEYKLDFGKSRDFSSYFGAGPTAFIYPKGHTGLDVSLTLQGKLEYSIKKFFMNTEVRVPIFFYQDSGHMDVLLSLNLGFKI